MNDTPSSISVPSIPAPSIPADAAASDSASATPRKADYQGLPWVSDPLGRKRLVATSGVTGMTYLVDLSVPGTYPVLRVMNATGFVDLEASWAPCDRLGSAGTADEAAAIAEADDYRYFASRARAAGQEPVAKPGLEPAGDLLDGESFAAAASFFEARTKGLKKNANGSWDLTLVVGRRLPGWINDGELGTPLLVGALSLGPAEDIDGSAHKKRIEDVFRRASIRPSEADFQEWLMRRYDLWGLLQRAAAENSEALEEAAAETLRRLVGVPSRSDLKINLDAVERFEALDREYFTDMAGAKGIYLPRRAASEESRRLAAPKRPAA